MALIMGIDFDPRGERYSQTAFFDDLVNANLWTGWAVASCIPALTPRVIYSATPSATTRHWVVAMQILRGVYNPADSPTSDSVS